MPEGFIPRVKNKSKPYANNSDVDSSKAGEKTNDFVPKTFSLVSSTTCREDTNLPDIDEK